MNWFDNYRQQNQHLFGEDSDFSDTEEDFEPEENEEIEIEESQETEDYEALKFSLNFKPVHNEKNNSKKFKKIFEKILYSEKNILFSKIFENFFLENEIFEN